MAKFTTCTDAASYFRAFQQIIDRVDPAAIDRYSELLFETWKRGGRVFVFGNGGSAYTASHHVADYVKTASVESQPRLQALSLNDNLGMLTALGNDLNYDDIFAWPLEAYASPGDVAVAISASGNSPNVVRAIEWAAANGLHTVAITGFTGGRIGELAQINIHFPSDNYGVVEDLQMAVGHIAAQSLQNRILQMQGVAT